MRKADQFIKATCICLMLLCAAAAAQEDELAEVRRELAEERAWRTEMKAEAARAPAAVADLWDARIKTCDKAIASFEKALQAGREEAYEAQLEDAYRWQHWSWVLEGLVHLESERAEYGGPPEDASAKEKQIHATIAALCKQARELCVKARPDEAPDHEASEAVEVSLSATGEKVEALRRALEALERKKDLLAEREGEQAPKLRQTLDKSVQRQDQLVAAIERLAAMNPEGNWEAFERAQQNVQKLERAAEASGGSYYLQRQKAEDEQRLAEAPAPLKPLIKEMMRYRAEAMEIQAKRETGDYTEIEAMMLETRADTLEQRAYAVEDVLDMRGEALEFFQDLGGARNDPRVRPLVQRVQKMLDECERLVRMRAETEIAARELETRVQLMYEKEERLRDGIYQAFERAMEVAEHMEEEGERIEELARPEELDRLRAELAERFQQFGGRAAEAKKFAPAIAKLTGAALEGALKHAQKAQDLHKAGRHEVRDEIVRAVQAAFAADELTDLLNTRIELEKMVVARGEQAKAEAVQACLAEFRKVSDAAAQAISASGDPKAAAQRGEVLAAARQLAAKLARLLGGKEAEWGEEEEWDEDED